MMRCFRFIAFLSFGIIVFPFTVIASDDSEAETESNPCFVLTSYRTESGLHLQLVPNASSHVFCFENVILYAFSGKPITIIVDGESSVYNSSSVILIPFSFLSGEEHSIVASSGSVELEWNLEVRSRISITDIDRDIDEIISMTSSDFNSKMLLTAATGFFVTVIGIYAAYRLVRYRAAHGVREI